MAFIPFAIVVRLLCIFIDFFCNLYYPAQETLFVIASNQRYRGNSGRSTNSKNEAIDKAAHEKFTHWMTYWVFYSVLYFI